MLIGDKYIFIGKIIPRHSLIRSDETYEWITRLTYYVEKYNLHIPKEIRKYVLSKS